ncbi:MrdA [Desulforapulum autotrophicum HRM2]|uniref:MrdA n=1 Tax=Desulforapulum autotrophicum (strain ATCC 43914 / DSM 3382 / VKM B-1955 / HRM2) TaxID=177437 RepID=C0Q985_DESAH|nr:penicillin-binding protein 2 [Desulforapulum autotrophicum]ACN16590.1 MrdA [Desulforapulum autotrophicum HRM2]
MKGCDRDWLKRRLMGGALFMLIAFAVLGARLFYLQVIQGEDFRRLSKNNCIRLKSVEASRGLIYDRNGVLLVDNRPSFDLSIVPKDAVPVDQTLEILSDFTQIPVVEMKARIDASKGLSKYTPILLEKGITRDQLAVVEAHSFDLPGVLVSVEPRRNYIFNKSSAHLLGYLGQINCDELETGKYPGVRGGDSIGRSGAEKVFEDHLRGQRGGRQVEVDASGRLVRVINTVDSVPGKNIFLTIDNKLQQIAENMLQDKAGAVVAMDPSNGDILVMASSPSFDQNDFIGGISSKKWKKLLADPDRPMSNKCIQGEYPPASTYKILTAIAGLEEGVVDLNTRHYCSGQYKFGNRIYRCWKRWGHGELDLLGAIEKSCDIYFYKVGEALGVDTLAQYANGCGLGKVTGIELEHERPGLIPTSVWKKRRYGVAWQPGETLSIAIGQGFDLVTPLQMAVFTAAIGNGGTLYRPRILKAIKTTDNEIIEIKKPEITGGLPAGKKTLDIVRKGLLDVVQGDRGTARGIRIKGVEIAGKTGTAQVFSLKKKDRDNDGQLDYRLRDHAWFVCYAPAENPMIALSILIEHGEHGSSTAAPVAGAIVRAYLEEKGIIETTKQAGEEDHV